MLIVFFFSISLSGDGNAKLGLSLIGKFSVAATFAIIYTYLPELLPTDMRWVGVVIIITYYNR